MGGLALGILLRAVCILRAIRQLGVLRTPEALLLDMGVRIELGRVEHAGEHAVEHSELVIVLFPVLVLFGFVLLFSILP